jgi:fatty acyl-ACP thioesterase A
MDKHASTREFEVLSGEGRLLARATSQWALINLMSRRITRVPEDIRQSYPVIDRRMLEDDFKRLAIPAKTSIERTFHVRLSDLDVNQHANSACYVDWCLEAVPEATHDHHVPLVFEINYLREASVREVLDSQSEGLAPEHGYASEFAHQIVRKSDGTRLAVAHSRWGEEVDAD